MHSLLDYISRHLSQDTYYHYYSLKYNQSVQFQIICLGMTLFKAASHQTLLFKIDTVHQFIIVFPDLPTD